MKIDIDALAQEIRRVDGRHEMGAGALAEALMPFLAKHSAIELDQQGRGESICNLWLNPKTHEYEVDRCTNPLDELIPVFTAPQPAEPVKDVSAHPGDALRWALRECGVRRDDNGAYFNEAALGKLAAILSRFWAAQPAAGAEPCDYADTAKRFQKRADEIEMLVGFGKMSAAACFTQMRQLIPHPADRFAAPTPPADGQAQQDADKPTCVAPMSDKPACGAQNAECERQRDAILQAIEEFRDRLPSSFLTVINAIKRGDA